VVLEAVKVNAYALRCEVIGYCVYEVEESCTGCYLVSCIYVPFYRNGKIRKNILYSYIATTRTVNECTETGTILIIIFQPSIELHIELHFDMFTVVSPTQQTARPRARPPGSPHRASACPINRPGSAGIGVVSTVDKRARQHDRKVERYPHLNMENISESELPAGL
jgi:hypothetical protein